MKFACIALAGSLTFATSAVAQRHFEVFIDAEGVHRSEDVEVRPGETEYVPEFDTGGGIGGGVNWFFSERFAVEAKLAAMANRMRIRTVGSDFVTTVDLGYTTMYPLSLVAQWHPFANKGFQPYIGGGLNYVFIPAIDPRDDAPEIHFGNAAGLILVGGVRIPIGPRWVLFGDARYVPVETLGTIQFGRGTTRSDMKVRPLLAAVGAAYRF